eukprot:SAG22_NODE_1687_length_3809_cov_11.008356_3_plen_382_part_00
MAARQDSDAGTPKRNEFKHVRVVTPPAMAARQDFDAYDALCAEPRHAARAAGAAASAPQWLLPLLPLPKHWQPDAQTARRGLRSSGGITAVYRLSSAIAAVGFSHYVLCTFALERDFCGAARGLVAAATALALARLLWRAPPEQHAHLALGCSSRAGAVRLLSAARTAPPRAHAMALAFAAVALSSVVTAVAWWTAGDEPLAALWSLIAAALALGCAALVLPSPSALDEGSSFLELSPMESDAVLSTEALEAVRPERYRRAAEVDCCPSHCPACCCGCGAATYVLLALLGAYHAVAMAALAHSPAAAERREVTVTAEAAAAAGRWVAPTQHAMRLHCIGEGSPAVVFLHGYSGQARDWSWVQPAVAATTKACTFDRSGCGE